MERMRGFCLYRVAPKTAVPILYASFVSNGILSGMSVYRHLAAVLVKPASVQMAGLLKGLLDLIQKPAVKFI